jgi:hypothetical protein
MTRKPEGTTGMPRTVDIGVPGGSSSVSMDAGEVRCGDEVEPVIRSELHNAIHLLHTMERPAGKSAGRN